MKIASQVRSAAQIYVERTAIDTRKSTETFMVDKEEWGSDASINGVTWADVCATNDCDQNDWPSTNAWMSTINTDKIIFPDEPIFWVEHYADFSKHPLSVKLCIIHDTFHNTRK